MPDPSFRFHHSPLTFLNVKKIRFLPVLVFLAAFLAAYFGSGRLPSLVAVATSLDASAPAESGPLRAKAPLNVAMQGHPDASPAASAPDKGTAILRPALNQGPVPAVVASLPASGALANALAARLAHATTPAELLRDADLSDPQVRALVVARMSELQDEQHEAALVKAERLGIPVRIEGPGRKVSVLYDFRGDKPLYRVTLNVNAAISTGANLLRDQSTPYGLDGTGMKVGVWDEARVRNTHREFTTTRVVLKDSATTYSDHSTHVAGTIGAAGTDPLAKGMAPKVSIDSYDWNSDYTEMTAAGAATATDLTRITVSNHSYGAGFNTAAEYVPYMGAYEVEAQTTDALAVSLPYYQIFWAAGNEQDYLLTKGGYQSITFNGLAKNIITIAAADDAVTSGQRDVTKGVLAYFSSEGPCDDGRIKPDLTANGVNLYSSVAFTPPAGTVASTTSYDGTYSGTSMATPNAVGSAVLIEQLYTREFPGQRIRASTLKALLINTADDVGRAGPDYQYGWGYLNAKAAADLILAHKASLASPKLIEGTLTSASKTKTHVFTWDGVTPIRATLCWTDPAGTALDPSIASQVDVRTPNLVNDLDLKITAPDGTTVKLPYVMPFVGTWTDASMQLAATTGVNHVDNVEQVYISSPAQAGNYTITVTLPGILTGSGQVYSLAVTGGTNVETNPPPVVTLDTPVDGSVLLPNVSVTLSATATDKIVGGGAGVVASVEFFNGTTSLGVDATAPYTLNWMPPAAGAYALTAKATDTEGAIGTSAIANLTVLTGDGTPTIASFSPASGTAGDTISFTGTNYAGVSSVKFNGVDALYTVVSATSITATVPATATTGTLSVTTPYGTATSATSFTVTQNPILISQIFGGGGNSGAPYNSDYVELYNRGATSVSLAGWSVQYGSASGTTWTPTALSGTIAAGKYYLVKLGSGGAIGSALPTADATGTINMSGTNGKVALRNTATAFTGSTPAGQTGLLDLVGYGTANAFEGSAAPAGSSTATDTANNAADFSASAPNPRNSTAGQPAAPVISSATTASGTVSQAFSYQIAASNTPTSFAATGLPAGLSVNTATGLISGTPTTAAVSSVTISATNATGTGTATLTITIAASGGGGGGATALSEDFATITSGDNTTTSGSSTAWTGNTNFPTATLLKAYQAGGAVKLGSSSATGSITTKALDLSGGGGAFSVTFKVKGWTTVEGSITVSATGQSAQTVTYTQVMAGTFESKTVNFTGGTSSTVITIGTTAKRAFIDDVVIATNSQPLTPAISTSGTLAAVGTIYGTASPTPTSFAVSGANMTAPIVVTPPSGFEVSQSVGGASGYAATQSIGTSGTIASTTVYLRLAVGTTVGTYSGNVVCSSAGATSVNVATVASSVSTRALVVTAQNRVKPFGTTLTLGTSAFDANGLVLGETVGAVTLSASGGTAANDATGTYVITPSGAIGGTFTATNYAVSYLPGVLTVTAPTFAEWSAGLVDSAASADPDHDGLANLLEYFFGLNAAVADAVAPQVSVVGSELRIDYRRSKALSGVSAAAEWTTSLAGAPVWSAEGVTDTLVSDQGAYEIRRATVSFTTGEPLKFLRLRVSQP
ncbi:hypothetical protein EBZ70_05665 [bacterium]|nr:hypothetical protein [bacterium]